MFQIKEQDKTSEKELNEMEISNVPNIQFQGMIIKMLTKLGRRMDEHSENFNKEVEYTKRNQSELKNTIGEMKNTLQGINSRLDDIEISDLEDRVVKLPKLKRKKKRIRKNEDSLRDFWDSNKHTNICIAGVPEGEEREKGAENLVEELTAENFPDLEKETDIQVQEAQRVLNKMNPKRFIT